MFSLVTLPDVIFDKIKSYVIFSPKSKEYLQNAVDLWCDDKKSGYKLYGHISLWDTKFITDISELFSEYINFNSVISSWDISNVINMHSIFYNAESFNQPLNKWDVGNVININSMFYYAISFNQPLDNWNISKVTNMNSMFCNTKSLSQIPNWYNK